MAKALMGLSLLASLRFSWRLLGRDLRSGEIRLLALALTVAVAAVTAVGFFTDRVQQALERESHQLLGADLLLVSDHPWSADALEAAQNKALQVVETRSFPSMVSAGEKAQLADVKAVAAGYPLRGAVQIAQTRNAVGLDAQGIPAPGSAWADERLVTALGLAVGDEMRLGALSLKLAAIITLEPDRGSNFLGVAPRLMVNLADVPATGLIQAGSRVAYRVLVAGEGRAVADFQQWLVPRLQRGERVEDTSNARPEIRSALERAQRFLGLASLLTVILAVVVVALAARRYVLRHLDASAVMRCMGASQRQLLQLHFGELLWLGLAVGLMGGVLGYGAHFALHGLLAEFVATRLPGPSLLPLAQGLVLALLLLLGFAGPPLLQLSRVPTLRVLRHELGAPRLPVLAAYGFGFGGLLALMFWVAGEAKLGAYVAGGFTLALGAFVLLARGAIALLARGVKSTGWGWRRGVAALNLRPWFASLQVVALALGLLAMVLLTATRGELLAAWQGSVPANAPNRFLINIQPEQRQDLEDFMSRRGLPISLAPMIRGRLLRIDDKAVSAATYPGNEQAQRLVEREFNLSWRAELPEGNQQVAGRWFQPGESGVVSVEEGLAKNLGIRVGSRVVFGVAGQELSWEVVGLRKLNWDSMRVNFFVLTPEADLVDQPASYITSFHLPLGQGDVVGELVQAFPNLTVIDVAAILQQLQRVIGQVSQAVQFVFVFTLAAGLIVLYAALVSAFDERQYELAVLRALGARRRQLQASLLAELAATGALAGLIAGLAATVLGQVLARKLFTLDLPFNFWLIPATTLAGAAISLAVGWWSVQKLLAVPPMAALRAGG